MNSFQWNGQNLELASLTPALKAKYCDWLRRKILADAPGLLSAQEAQTLRHALMAGGVVFWRKNPSPAVAASLMSPDGLGQLVKFLLGSQVEKWPASEIEALLTEVGTNGPLDQALAEVLSEGTAIKVESPAPVVEPQAA